MADFLIQARKDCAPHIAIFRETWAELTKFSHNEIRQRVRSAIEANISAIKMGDADSVQVVPDEEKIAREYEIRRKALREKLRAASNACKPSVTAVAEKFQAACRTVAEKMFAEEKNGAEAIGVQFDQPSAALKQIIAGGFEGKEFLDLAFHPSPGADPADAVFGLLKGE
jgi:hypothetical protein